MRIQEAAEGNPLFVEEMFSMLIDDGLLQRDNGRWIATGDLAEVRVPPSIQALLASRLDRLEADERHVVERAAVEGKTFHEGSVRALAEGPARERVGACLLSLVRKELVQPHTSAFAGEDAFRFRHVLIREAAYDSIPKQLRAQLHDRFAPGSRRSSVSAWGSTRSCSGTTWSRHSAIGWSCPRWTIGPRPWLCAEAPGSRGSRPARARPRRCNCGGQPAPPRHGALRGRRKRAHRRRHRPREGPATSEATCSRRTACSPMRFEPPRQADDPAAGRAGAGRALGSPHPSRPRSSISTRC